MFKNFQYKMSKLSYLIICFNRETKNMDFALNNH